MNKIRCITILLLCVSGFALVHASDYYSRYDFLMAPPAEFQDGLVGHANPATIGKLQSFESRVYWTDKDYTGGRRNWGVFSGFKGFGFSLNRRNVGDARVSDYSISLGGGSDAGAFGLSYNWSKGDEDVFQRQKMINAGMITQPNSFLSFGLTGYWGLESEYLEGMAEIGVRPLGTPAFTLFADAALHKQQRIGDARWSAGASIQPVPGIHLVGRYFDNETITAGFVINLGFNSFGMQSFHNSDSELLGKAYVVRMGGMKPSFANTLVGKGKGYVPFEMKGSVDYLKFAFFDDETSSFKEVIEDIRAAARDPRISTLAFNLSAMQIRSEHAWEIRQELESAKVAGKKIIMFIDRVGLTHYYFASVADAIVLDPQGMLLMPGYLMNRTYLKGTMEKLGLGFDEWRFFKYKSAAESYSRDQMSDPAREQLQAYLDDWYTLVRDEVAAARDMTSREFEQIIDETYILSANQALKAGLVDTLARWSDKDEVLEQLTGRSLLGIHRNLILDNVLTREDWGLRPRIALIYGLGECAMDSGIRARWLQHVFKRVTNDASIDAVVFRVDSPGGDGMASDVVAEALRECARKKPVIVSQGQVAASGGYWISMYADTIVAAPNTVTGSIGVIGGWVWDKSFSDKLGMTSDHVQRGEHADAYAGVTLPLLGLRIPARPLTDDESERVKKQILLMYEDFVQKVAEGRNMSVERVREIAQGRIYSGTDGKDVNLVDKIGGLFTAIEIAKRQAGIEDDPEIIEIPENKGLWAFPSISPFQAKIEKDPAIQYIKMLTENPGVPLYMVSPDLYPLDE